MKKETKEHVHQWHNAGKVSDEHDPKHKHLSFIYLQLCDCGRYKHTKFVHEDEDMV